MPELKSCPFCGGKVSLVLCDDEGNLHDNDDYKEHPYSGLGFMLHHAYEENPGCPIASYECDGGILGGVYIYGTEEQAAEVDIDHSYSQGMSSVSQATLALLLALDLVHAKDITIVGRGHAVQNLAKYLTLGNATVTVAHSKTKSLLQATMNRDVVIYATPTITKDISYNTRDLVIDLGNSVPHPDRFNCPYVNRIGQLTVSVLLNRFARKEHRA